MLKLLRQIIDFVLFSNVFIALCALSFYWLTFYQMNLRPQLDMMAAIVFIATLFVYILQRLLVLRLHKVVPNQRQEWFYDHLQLMKAISIFCFGFLCVSVFFIDLDQFIALGVISLISIFYGYPFTYKKIRLRDIGIIKIFLISFSWAYVSTVLPFVSIDEQLFTPKFFLIFLERFLFIFAITLPFDIRDQQIDQLYDLKTIPVIFGQTKTKIISIMSLLVVTGILLIEHRIDLVKTYFLWAMIIGCLVTIAIILLNKKDKSDYYYLGLLDGMIILQLLLVVIFNLF